MSRPVFLPALALGFALIACGSDDDPRALSRDTTGDASPATPAPADPPEGAFGYAPDLALLPFDVRLAKVAKVAGVGIDDPILATLIARRFDLGDHDYAKGIKPDLTWSAARIGAWVKALKPVCASPAMKARYATLATGANELDTFFLAAYGRNATPEDRAAIDETVAKTALDSESQYQVSCLAILTSLEFVAR